MPPKQLGLLVYDIKEGLRKQLNREPTKEELRAFTESLPTFFVDVDEWLQDKAREFIRDKGLITEEQAQCPDLTCEHKFNGGASNPCKECLQTTIVFKNFVITVANQIDHDAFFKELDKLCDKYAVNKEAAVYDYKDQ